MLAADASPTATWQKYLATIANFETRLRYSRRSGSENSKGWQREGRKISRVAESLSISPKKVRRILRNAGLLGTLHSDAHP